ncbi:hypothetical protein YC2023_081807 [Brassica napus]
MNAFTPQSQKPATAELKKPPPPGNRADGDRALTTTDGDWNRAQTRRSGKGGEGETGKKHLNRKNEGFR